MKKSINTVFILFLYGILYIYTVKTLPNSHPKGVISDEVSNDKRVNTLSLEEIDLMHKKVEERKRSIIFDKAFELVSKYESFSPTSYYCSAGVKTIGYGTTKYSEGSISEKDARKLVYEEFNIIYKSLKKELKVYQTENQIASLISLCYNISHYSFRKSTLLKRINEGAPKELIKEEFLKWVNIRVYVNNKSFKKPLKGLIKRRTSEYHNYIEEV